MYTAIIYILQPDSQDPSWSNFFLSLQDNSMPLSPKLSRFQLHWPPFKTLIKPSSFQAKLSHTMFLPFEWLLLLYLGKSQSVSAVTEIIIS